MSTVTVSQVTSSREMRAFVRFNYELYKECPYAVPDLLEDTLETLDARRNPAFRFCEAAFFLAHRDGRIVGRVAAIINNRAKIINKNRFSSYVGIKIIPVCGYFDFFALGATSF